MKIELIPKRKVSERKGETPNSALLYYIDIIEHRLALLSQDTDFSVHTALTAAHGATGAVVGTTNTQELDNKTLDSSVGKGTWTASGTWTLPAHTVSGLLTAKTGRQATCIIAASNASATWRAHADAVCDGTTDVAAINTYLVADTRVVLSPGTFNIATAPNSITFGASNETLEGQGQETILKVPNSTNADVRVIGYSGSPVNCHVKNFTIDGNKANQASGTFYGVLWTNMTNSTIEKLYIKDIKGTGLYLNNSLYSVVRDCYIHDWTLSAIYLQATDYDTIEDNIMVSDDGVTDVRGIRLQDSQANKILHNIILGTLATAGQGIYHDVADECSYNIIDNNYVEGFGLGITFIETVTHVNNTGNSFTNNKLLNGLTWEALRVEYSPRSIISGNSIHTCQRDGIEILEADNSNISNNQVFVSSQQTDNTFDAITIYSDNCVITDNNVKHGGGAKTNKQAIVVTGDYNQISQNNVYLGFSTTPAISATGTGNKVADNMGFLTESSGSSTGTGAQQTIAHGLAVTPTAQQIALTAGSATALPFHSAAPDATNIYVTAALNQTWYWATVGK